MKFCMSTYATTKMYFYRRIGFWVIRGQKLRSMTIISKNVFWQKLIKDNSFYWLSWVHNIWNFYVILKNYGLSKFGSWPKNGLEAKTLDGHNSATIGRRRLRFCMNKFLMHIFEHTKFSQNRRWSKKLVAEINQFWPVC